MSLGELFWTNEGLDVCEQLFQLVRSVVKLFVLSVPHKRLNRFGKFSEGSRSRDETSCSLPFVFRKNGRGLVKGIAKAFHFFEKILVPFASREKFDLLLGFYDTRKKSSDRRSLLARLDRLEKGLIADLSGTRLFAGESQLSQAEPTGNCVEKGKIGGASRVVRLIH